VNADGSFSATVTAIPGQRLTITATDVVGRATLRSLGSTYGTTSSYLSNPAVASNDLNYRARRIASDGSVTVVGSGSLYGAAVPTSNKLLFFRQSAPGVPQVATFAGGGVQDVKVSAGWAYVTGDRLGTIDLSDPALTTHLATNSDPCGRETSLVLSGQYAFTSEVDCNQDGRVHIYDVGTPTTPVWVRSQGVAGFGGLTYRGLVALGTQYVIGLSPDKPGGSGHDLIVMDRSNINTLTKAVDFDIPSFDALDGVVDGNMLYVAGGDGGVAIVDMTFPTAPVVKSIINTPGIARGIAIGGVNEIVVADAGGPGLTVIDVTDKSHPVITGTQKLTGNIVDVDVVGKWIYVAGENRFHTVVRP